MSKPFYEVFPALELDSRMKEQMEQVEVEKVTSNSRRDFLRIYILSTHLIQKETIFKVEKEIKAQLFPKAVMTIKIYEKFRLPSTHRKSCWTFIGRAYRKSSVNMIIFFTMRLKVPKLRSRKNHG